mmetsp:Transcript_11482/g.49473  ORF Transcript_11482/g.49473 Transcript_11482/m.49473 type:complete len:245 (-) Transcript_11482:689-1423(-)
MKVDSMKEPHVYVSNGASSSYTSSPYRLHFATSSAPIANPSPRAAQSSHHAPSVSVVGAELSTTSTASLPASAHRMHSAVVGGAPSVQPSGAGSLCNEFHRVVVNATTGTSLAIASGNSVRSDLTCAMLYLAMSKSSSHGSKSKSFFAVFSSPSSFLFSSSSSFPSSSHGSSPMNPRRLRCDRSSLFPAHLSCVEQPTYRITPSTPALPPSPTTKPPSFLIHRIVSTASVSWPLCTYSRKNASM